MLTYPEVSEVLEKLYTTFGISLSHFLFKFKSHITKPLKHTTFHIQKRNLGIMASTIINRIDANKRQIMGVLSDNSNSSSSSSVNLRKKDHLVAFLQDAHDQLETEKDKLTNETNKAKQELKQTHAAGMLKLAKSIKKMTIREFNQQYNCNLLEVVFANRSIVPSNAKKRIRNELETPAAKKTNLNNLPNTLTRTVHRFEAL